MIQLTLRCLELLGAMGLLVTMILIKNVDVTTGWIMRIAVSAESRKEYTAEFQLMVPSLALPYFTLSMGYIIWQDAPRAELQHRRLHICSLQHSSMSLSSRSMRLVP